MGRQKQRLRLAVKCFDVLPSNPAPNFAVAPSAPTMVSPDETSVRAVLAERLPVRTSWAALELASAALFTVERPLVHLRWSRVAPDGSVLSSLEGAMNLGPARRGGEPVSPERLRALLQGFADFVGSAKASLAESLTSCSPAELFGSALVHKKSARTREDFYRLFLSRFGGAHAIRRK
jgi:hypothetical protein